MDVNLSPTELPGWQDVIPPLPKASKPPWQKVSRKHRSTTPDASPHLVNIRALPRVSLLGLLLPFLLSCKYTSAH